MLPLHYPCYCPTHLLCYRPRTRYTMSGTEAGVRVVGGRLSALSPRHALVCYPPPTPCPVLTYYPPPRPCPVLRLYLATRCPVLGYCLAFLTACDARGAGRGAEGAGGGGRHIRWVRWLSPFAYSLDSMANAIMEPGRVVCVFPMCLRRHVSVFSCLSATPCPGVVICVCYSMSGCFSVCLLRHVRG